MEISLKLLFCLALFNAVHCQERRFVHTKEELELITLISEDIVHLGCREHDVAMIVHSAAQTTGKYYEKRVAARNTWVKDATARNISVIFAIAMPRDAATQAELKAESDLYKDMVQFSGFIDDYWNLTLKAVAVNNWLTKFCTYPQFVAKLDDDVFVNVDRFVDNRYLLENGVTGHKYGYRTQPIRDPESRYYMPEEAYPPEWYPTYISGLFYVMTRDIILPLYTYASEWSEIVLDFDDLYMTGIVADRFELQRHRSTEIVFRENTNPNCGITDVRELNQLIAYHGCSTAEFSINLYTQWKQQKYLDFKNETNK